MATGDSVTSAHLQLSHAYPVGNCVGNTSADFRVPKLPGNDMIFSYAGKYVANHNRNVTEYFNFARTGMGTGEIRGAGPGHADACRNPWARNSPPIDLADRAIRQAKADRKAAYFVTTGGVNNTNWTEVLTGIAKCGTADHYKDLVQRYFDQHGQLFKAITEWYDLAGKVTTKPNVINGGSCDVRIEGDRSGIRYVHRRIEIKAYDGPAHYAAIKADVESIVEQVLDAGADKVVWMGYYDISRAGFDIGMFAETYRAALDKEVLGLLPGQIPSDVRDLIDDPGWKATVQRWTQEINAVILAGLPRHDRVRFAPPPALGPGDIQQTGLGGCPHPNEPGHRKLAAVLDNVFG
ncbi:hypothetical protein [Micromonospora endolithica]|uniref:hypothetical protein n=1 Tax=Micromonospora endolithica TaxID=230091 RepID=UPI0011BF1DAC|nr:hypothetical protein [Micromonospora endolithica]